MLINLYEDRQDSETDIKVPDYPFKKIHNREFSSLDLITLVSTFNSIIDNQNANSNHCNDNRVRNHNIMINPNRDAQSSNWNKQQSLFEKI